MSSKDIGIDLGTANTLIYIKTKGIVLNEPSVVAIDSDTQKVVCAGIDAKNMLERTPSGLVAARPVCGGAVSDFEMTRKMLSSFINKIKRYYFAFKPCALVCIPAGLTSVERKAVFEIVSACGFKSVTLIEEPMAAAVGAGLDTNSASGCMICDIGGGTTEVAVISLGGIVSCSYALCGGDSMDHAIRDYIKNKYGILIGAHSVEQIKTENASVLKGNTKDLQIFGRNYTTGLPCSVNINTDDIKDAILPEVYKIVDLIKSVFEQTPPELCSDVLKSGITLCGGGSLIDGIDRLICETTGLAVRNSDSPLECVAAGLGKILEESNRKKLFEKKYR